MSEQSEIKQNIRETGYAATSATGNAAIYINNYYYREEVRVKPVESVEASDENLPCPYRGLFHFGPNDAEFFFGRETFIEELYITTETRNFIPVLGASGSGKSSVVLAGLVPKLQNEGHWQFTHFRPGSDPFHAIALALVPLYTLNLDQTEQIVQGRKLADYLKNGSIPLSDVFAKIQQNQPNHRVLLIADQFEEIYTLCNDQEIRRKFLDCLLTSLVTPTSLSSSATVLVTTMRADFLGNALSYRPFADVLQNADLKLGPMNREELTEVIEKPAQKLGVTFETALVERILKDVEDQPGNLPLLEFALTELWNKRTGKQLTHKIYEEIGQVEGALARHADEKYGNLTDDEKEKVRRIFIQLVRPGEGAEDTRRIAMKAELGEQSWSLVKQLADARLVVTSRNLTSQETVEVVHEALIRNWGELREWMNANRVFRAWQERLRGVKRQWEVTNRDLGSLLRGAALAEAEERLKERPEDLIDEKEFIEQSIQEQYRLKQVEAARRNREIRTAWGIAMGSLVAVVISVGLGAVAFSQYQTANQEKQKADEQAKIALARQLATQANLKGDEGNLQEFSTLNTSSQEFTLRLGLDSFPSKVVSLLKGIKPQILRFSPDEKLMVVTDDKFLRFFQIDNGKVIKVSLPGIVAMSFSPDVSRLATAGEDATLTLWDVKTGTEISNFKGHQASLTATAFSPDGKLLVTGSSDKTARLWNVDGMLITTIAGHQDYINSAVFSPDGRYILTASRDHTAKVWSIQGESIRTLVHDGPVKLAVFSPDEQSIITVSGDTVVRIFSSGLYAKR